MKGPLILVIAVVVVFAVGVGLFWGRSTVSVSNTITTNALPAALPPAPPSTQATVVLPEAVAPDLRPTPREIVGIGAVISRNDAGEHLITGVVPDSPAAAAGLAGKFIIRKIDDTVTEGMSLQECVSLVRGVAGTRIRLELFDVEAGEARIVELTRQKVQLQKSLPVTR